MAVLEGSYATKRRSELFTLSYDALKQGGPLGEIMGLEMIGLLVHEPTLRHLLSLPWSELKLGMEKASLRAHRPVQDKILNTSFAIDAEAELLDWMDQQAVESSLATAQALSQLKDGEEGLLHLMKWASPGQWEVWEGRAFLYLENATGEDAEDIHELYSQQTWDLAKQRLHGIADGEYAERGVMDWMERRKALGETLDETLDPKIVPTFEAHTRASKALVYAVNRAMNEDDLVFVVGREHLEASKWGHGAWNLSAFLQSL